MKQLFLLFSLFLCPHLQSAHHLPGTRETVITWYFGSHEGFTKKPDGTWNIDCFFAKNPSTQSQGWLSDYLNEQTQPQDELTQQAVHNPEQFLIVSQHKTFVVAEQKQSSPGATPNDTDKHNWFAQYLEEHMSPENDLVEQVKKNPCAFLIMYQQYRNLSLVPQQTTQMQPFHTCTFCNLIFTNRTFFMDHFYMVHIPQNPAGVTF